MQTVVGLDFTKMYLEFNSRETSARRNLDRVRNQRRSADLSRSDEPALLANRATFQPSPESGGVPSKYCISGASRPGGPGLRIAVEPAGGR